MQTCPIRGWQEVRNFTAKPRRTQRKLQSGRSEPGDKLFGAARPPLSSLLPSRLRGEILSFLIPGLTFGRYRR